MESSVTLQWQGDEWSLLPEAALWRPSQRLLMVSDLHLGKSASLRAIGVPVPEGHTADDLTRLSDLIHRSEAQTLCIVGDLFHHAVGWTTEIQDQLTLWRNRHPQLGVTLVQGNHDRVASRLPPSLMIDRVSSAVIGGVRFIHEPEHATTDLPSICGHLHPGLRLRISRRLSSARTPVFWVREGMLVLPSFGSFTGTQSITPTAGDRVYALAEGRILEIPPALWP